MENSFALFVSDCALKALLYELSAGPKPGLVDRLNNGAHKDMGFLTFIDSAISLRPWFFCFADFAATSSLPEQALLAGARSLGERAERAMLNATGGINTHKGAIFSLGLICLAAGRLYAAKNSLTPGGLCALAGIIASDTPGELEGAAAKALPTHGEAQYLLHGLTGIRGEAAKGFPSVTGAGFPVLEGLIKNGVSENDASVITLLHLMAKVEDTNAVRRGGLARARELCAEIGNVLARENDVASLIDYAAELDKRLIAENISPGGCADLLAVCWFVKKLCS
ncbi:MAG: triphosphoribosyl-dephospho-CoA synthase [Oscillospiraceae bacterium]|jgi:holo-ACP synthase/triphosphoribosyl-dephospho-CoA synthase|nr:triphosphoribosyl-dephospho-CoA synthase [Oscillospiraceae bacterium]